MVQCNNKVMVKKLCRHVIAKVAEIRARVKGCIRCFENPSISRYTTIAPDLAIYIEKFPFWAEIIIPGWRRKSEREGALSSPTVPVVHTDFCYSLVDEPSRDGVERVCTLHE
ncbi:14366_t:CDS:2 [Cetraspora pellucida]|uniref:14366_t:CDS:1 n=1 Tax=Cetraspora pellucida TaxID=1433469 RepID=A0A9N9A542_9GLOM|nr:14366_t:CDS:2 [Cetraspora pellucida]